MLQRPSQYHNRICNVIMCPPPAFRLEGVPEFIQKIISSWLPNKLVGTSGHIKIITCLTQLLSSCPSVINYLQWDS
eukprot:c21740_g1_i4 orf=111-338(+)